MAAVCAAEGLTVNAATLDALVEAANQDLRLVTSILNQPISLYTIKCCSANEEVIHVYRSWASCR